MNTFFEKIQRYDLLRAILFLIAGLIILIAPRSVFNTIVYLICALIFDVKIAIYSIIYMLDYILTARAAGWGKALSSR